MEGKAAKAKITKQKLTVMWKCQKRDHRGDTGELRRCARGDRTVETRHSVHPRPNPVSRAPRSGAAPTAPLEGGLGGRSCGRRPARRRPASGARLPLASTSRGRCPRPGPHGGPPARPSPQRRPAGPDRSPAPPTTSAPPPRDRRFRGGARCRPGSFPGLAGGAGLRGGGARKGAF